MRNAATKALEIAAAGCALAGDVMLFWVSVPAALLVTAVLLLAVSWAASR